jgi:hypothetical protein
MKDRNINMSPEVFVGVSYGAKIKDPYHVLEVVSSIYDIDPLLLSDNTRKQPIPDARKTFCLLARKYNREVTTPEIGKMLNKDHSTVVMATKKAHEFYSYDEKFRIKMDRCDKIIRGGLPSEEFDKDNFRNCIGYYYIGEEGKKELNEWAKENDIVTLMKNQ